MSEPHEVEDNKDLQKSSDTDGHAATTATAKQAEERPEKSFAEQIDESAWFYFLYGVLDGLSVSYSTLKYLCEITTGSSKEYAEALETALSDPEWLLLVISGSLLITGISALANYFEKTEKKALNKDPNKQNTRKFWDYARDILKGAKNGYKGTKGFIAMFLALEVLDHQQYVSLVLPIGLIISAVSIINRCWQRSMLDERKDREKKSTDATKKVNKLNEFLQRKQDLRNELFALDMKIKRAEKIEEQLKEIENYKKDAENISVKLDNRDPLKPFAQSKGKSQSTPDLARQNSKEKIVQEKKELLTAPEIQYYLQSIQQLEEAINEQQLPTEKTNLQHPLLEKLNRQKKQLEALQAQKQETKTFELDDLRRKHEKKYAEYRACIKQQKRQDTLSLTQSLVEDKKHLEALRPALFRQLNDLEEAQRAAFFKEVNELDERYKKQVAEIASLNQQHEALNDDIAYLKNRQRALSAQEQLKLKELTEKEAKNELDKKAAGQEKKRLIEALYNFYIESGIQAEQIEDFDADFSFQELDLSKERLADYRAQTREKLLWSKVIGAFADAPYLYAGILGIVLVSPPGPLLWALTAAIVAFSVTAIFTRRNEEIEDDHKCQRIILENELSKLHNEWKDAQNQYYKAHAKLEEYLSEHEEPDEKEVKRLKQLRQVEVQRLVAVYNRTQDKRAELKNHLMPTYQGAFLNGLKDGLTLFGATASLFYAINIILLLSGGAFPPALIIGAIAFGVIAMIGFSAFRLYHATNLRKEIEECIHVQKANEAELHSHKPSLVLGMEDDITDGLTKGELLFQEINELLRILGSTAGKSQNLWNFLLGGLSDGIALALGCMLSVTYIFVLLTRGFAKVFKNVPKKKAEDKKQDNKTQSLKDSSQQGPDPFESNQPPSANNSQHSSKPVSHFKTIASGRTSPTFFSPSPSPSPESPDFNTSSTLSRSPFFMLSAPPPFPIEKDIEMVSNQSPH